MSERRVVCAAIRAADRSLLLGIRHYSMDMHVQIKARVDGQKFVHRHDEDQGFVDQFGVWMDRFEAFEVASNSGQLLDVGACRMSLRDGRPAVKLYSEGLY